MNIRRSSMKVNVVLVGIGGFGMIHLTEALEGKTKELINIVISCRNAHFLGKGLSLVQIVGINSNYFGVMNETLIRGNMDFGDKAAAKNGNFSLAHEKSS